MAKLKEIGIQKILILGAVGYSLILVAVFITVYLLGQVPAQRLFPILGAIALISTISVLISFIFLRKATDLTETAERLRHGLKELQRMRAICVSNQELKQYYESEASKIRVISPDLYDDFNIFYETILANIRLKKTYEYIIPKREEVESRMEELLEKLQHDLGVNKRDELLIRHKKVEFPVITEYVLYQTPSGEKELEGFMEVRYGPTDQDTTNVPLNENEKHIVNNLFQTLFR